MWVLLIILGLVIWAIANAHEKQQEKIDELQDRVDELDGGPNSEPFHEDIDDL